MQLREYGPLATIVAGAAVLRFATLDLQSFWFDEAFTVTLVRRPLDEMMGEIPETESTPPLYYLLAWAWSRVFGAGEVGLRSLSALLGTSTVPLMYLAGRALISRRAGLVTAALVGASPLLVWYSQEARSYPLLFCLSALSLVAFAQALRDPRPRNVLFWALACSLALATHYFAAFLSISEAIVLLVKTKARRPPLLATGLIVATGFALLPLAMYQEAGGRVRHIEASDFNARVRDLIQQFLAGNYAVGHATLIGILAFEAFVVLALVLTVRSERRGALVVVVLALGALGLPLALAAVGLDYFATRNVISASLPIALICGAALGGRRAGLAGLAATAVLCALLLYATVEIFSRPALHRDDWRATARAIGTPERERALVVLGYGMRALQIYRPTATVVADKAVRVREIVLVAASPAYRARVEGLLPTEFRLVEARGVQHLFLFRLSSPRPRRVDVSAIERRFAGFPQVQVAVDSPTVGGAATP